MIDWTRQVVTREKREIKQNTRLIIDGSIQSQIHLCRATWGDTLTMFTPSTMNIIFCKTTYVLINAMNTAFTDTQTQCRLFQWFAIDWFAIGIAPVRHFSLLVAPQMLQNNKSHYNCTQFMCPWFAIHAPTQEEQPNPLVAEISRTTIQTFIMRIHTRRYHRAKSRCSYGLYKHAPNRNCSEYVNDHNFTWMFWATWLLFLASESLFDWYTHKLLNFDICHDRLHLTSREMWKQIVRKTRIRGAASRSTVFKVITGSLNPMRSTRREDWGKFAWGNTGGMGPWEEQPFFNAGWGEGFFWLASTSKQLNLFWIFLFRRVACIQPHNSFRVGYFR